MEEMPVEENMRLGRAHDGSPELLPMFFWSVSRVSRVSQFFCVSRVSQFSCVSHVSRQEVATRLQEVATQLQEVATRHQEVATRLQEVATQRQEVATRLQEVATWRRSLHFSKYHYRFPHTGK